MAGNGLVTDKRICPKAYKGRMGLSGGELLSLLLAEGECLVYLNSFL